MFTNGVESSMTKPNEKGEYSLAQGVTSEIFSIVLVRITIPHTEVLLLVGIKEISNQQ